MEKNQPYFDPYNFNMQNFMQTQENTNFTNDINPNSYYEGQYIYYKYLTQMMEYRIKCKELDNITRQENTKKS